jgi:hypothetical protein
MSTRNSPLLYYIAARSLARSLRGENVVGHGPTHGAEEEERAEYNEVDPLHNVK